MKGRDLSYTRRHGNWKCGTCCNGYHARVDGWTSLAVLFGALGVWSGHPLSGPVIGLLITMAILRIVWHSGKEVFTRLFDGIEPERLDEIRAIAPQTQT